jgi:RNA polymerase sigma factor (sigma-70 family)
MSHEGGSRAGPTLTPVQQALSATHMEFIERVSKAKGRHYAWLLRVEDAAAIGQMAQVSAALSFDPSRGDFPTYASWRARGAIANAAKKEAPHAEALALGAYAKVCEHLAEASDPVRWDHGEEDFRRDGDAFAAEVLGTAFASVVGGILRGAGGEDGIAQRQLYQRAVAAMRTGSAKLSGLQQEILYLHFGQEVELKEIAALKGLSYSTILRHRDKALVTLKKVLAEAGIRSSADAGLEE